MSLWLSNADKALAADSELELVLRTWVQQNIRFEKGTNDRETLFIRKRPVRAYINSDDPEIVAEARTTVANLANAFGLEYSFTADRVNMIIATSDRIAVDGKPSKTLLAALGLPAYAADYIADKDGWSSGCGMYAARDNEGRVSFGLAVGDKSLSAKKLKLCTTTGIVFAFGLRTGGQEILDDYVQFLLLARSLIDCEKKFGAQNTQPIDSAPDAYVACAVSRLKAKLSE